jgi:hypothetical protein
MDNLEQELKDKRTARKALGGLTLRHYLIAAFTGLTMTLGAWGGWKIAPDLYLARHEGTIRSEAEKPDASGNKKAYGEIEDIVAKEMKRFDGKLSETEQDLIRQKGLLYGGLAGLIVGFPLTFFYKHQSYSEIKKTVKESIKSEPSCFAGRPHAPAGDFSYQTEDDRISR